jgi:chromosome segregation ATPase
VAPVIRELSEIVHIREQQLARAEQLHRQAAVSDAEILQARGELSQARIALLQKQQALADGTPGDRMSELNRALSQVQIDMEATEAQLQFLKQEVEEARERLKMAAEYETGVSLKLPMLIEQLSELSRSCADLERGVSSMGEPKFEIIGAE